MKDKIYYIVFFAGLVITVAIGILYQFKFPYWLYSTGGFIIFGYLKDVFTGLNWFEVPRPKPISNPGMTEAAYQKIVAGYPDLNETEKKGYETLTKLCVGVNQEKVLSFIRSLKDYSNDVDDRSTLNVVMDFLDDNYIHFIIGLDGRSAIKDLKWHIEGALKQNFDQQIKLPAESDYPENASVSYDNVFINFDASLRKYGFQMGFIAEGSDSYIIIVHKIEDKNSIIQSVLQIGYPYYDCKDDISDVKSKQILIAPFKAVPEKKFLGVHVIILLICPVFSYGAYKLYVEEGISKNVVLICVLNLLFYWFSISQIISALKTKQKDD